MHSDFHIQYRTRLMLEICYCHTLSLPVLQILGHAAGSSDRCHRTYFLLLNSKGKPQNFHLGDRIRFVQRSVQFPISCLPQNAERSYNQTTFTFFIYLDEHLSDHSLIYMKVPLFLPFQTATFLS